MALDLERKNCDFWYRWYDYAIRCIWTDPSFSRQRLDPFGCDGTLHCPRKTRWTRGTPSVVPCLFWHLHDRVSDLVSVIACHRTVVSNEVVHQMGEARRLQPPSWSSPPLTWSSPHSKTILFTSPLFPSPFSLSCPFSKDFLLLSPSIERWSWGHPRCSRSPYWKTFAACFPTMLFPSMQDSVSWLLLEMSHVNIFLT